MKIREAINRIENVLYRETSKFPQLNDDEAKSRLASAKKGLEAIMASSIEKGELSVPHDLEDLLDDKGAITPERATDIDSAVTAWRRDRDNGNEGKPQQDKKRPILSKILYGLSFISLGISVLSLIIGLIVSFKIDDKDTLFFAIEGSKDIWNNIFDVLSIICPGTMGAAALTTITNKSAKSSKQIKANSWTWMIASVIGIIVSCVIVGFRLFGKFTPTVSLILFVLFIIIMVISVVSLWKHDGEEDEEQKK